MYFCSEEEIDVKSLRGMNIECALFFIILNS